MTSQTTIFPIDWDEDPLDDSGDCFNCGGGGFVHDCGEDTCCCLLPEEDSICHQCGGRGYI